MLGKAVEVPQNAREADEKKDNNSLNKHIFKHINQAWRGRNRQERGHHSLSSTQGEWLAIDIKKNNILASLSLASYLAANWLQKLETKHYAYYAEVISVLMCVCGMVSQFDLSITKQN